MKALKTAGLFLSGVLLLFSLAHASPPLSVYGALPGIEKAALSPSGNHVAVVGIVGEERSLVVLAGDKPIFQQSVGSVKVRRLDWAGEDRVLVTFTKTVHLAGFTVNKMEAVAVLIVPIDGSKPTSVFENARNIEGGVRGFHGMFNQEGRWYGYFGGITLAQHYFDKSFVFEDGNPELYRVDLTNGDTKRIAQRAGGDMRRDWLMAPNGEIAATLDFNSSVGNWAIRNGKGETIVEGSNPLGGIDLIGLNASSDTLIYSRQDEDSAGYTYFEVALSGGQPGAILNDDALSDPLVDRRSKRVLGYVKDQDYPETHLFDPRRERILRAAERAFPDLHVSLIDWSENFETLIVSTEGNNDAGTWWLVNLKTGQADMIGRKFAVAPADIGPVRMIQYKASDGTDIAGVLTLPPGRQASNLPVVVFPHGGPSSRNYPEFDWWAQAFASRGYAVLQPNFRGSTGYGAAFYKAGFGQWGQLQQTDISAGLAELVRQGIVDPRRACIMGASYGGYAALAGVTLQHGIYRCAVSVAGVSDVEMFSTMLRNDSLGNGTVIRSLTARIGDTPDLKAISPRHFADQADAPILLIHGKDDTRVLYEQSKWMADALRSAGKPVEMVTLVGEDHFLSLSETRLKMLESAVRFIEFHNPPELSPVAQK